MQWLTDLVSKPESAAHAALVLSVVAVLGLALGSVKIRGIGLGIAGVLFAGLAAGGYGMKVESGVLEFVREFGLILFVYTIGVQVGPGFFGSLRKNGLSLNLMAAAIVLGGAGLTVVLWALFLGGGRSTLPAAVGLLSGGVTNTPSLAAAQQALRDSIELSAATRPATMPTTMPTTVAAVVGGHGEAAGLKGPGSELVALPGQAYAVAYPFGIVGIILTMIVVRKVYRIDVAAELAEWENAAGAGRAKLSTVNIKVVNPRLAGRRLSEVPTLAEGGVVVSRLLRAGRPEIATPESVIQPGDVLLAVGPEKRLDELRVVVGEEAAIDLRALSSDIAVQQVLVTHNAVVGKSLAELAFTQRYSVNITRVARAGIELPVYPDLRLAVADAVTVVGEKASLKQVSAELGDSAKHLSHPAVIPLFVGIALGVLVGSIPLVIPGMPAPVRLGLAGGPLVVAILLSKLGRLGPLNWYLPTPANLALRELGIVLFLACVGVKGGAGFVQTLKVNGPLWLGLGAVITMLPIMVMGLLARGVWKMNYMTLCGLIAGSMTDPPALAFSQSVTGSDAPSVAYATVYPLVMLLRIVTAQLIVILLF